MNLPRARCPCACALCAPIPDAGRRPSTGAPSQRSGRGGHWFDAARAVWAFMAGQFLVAYPRCRKTTRAAFVGEQIAARRCSTFSCRQTRLTPTRERGNHEPWRTRPVRDVQARSDQRHRLVAQSRPRPGNHGRGHADWRHCSEYPKGPAGIGQDHRHAKGDADQHEALAAAVGGGFPDRDRTRTTYGKMLTPRPTKQSRKMNSVSTKGASSRPERRLRTNAGLATAIRMGTGATHRTFG